MSIFFEKKKRYALYKRQNVWYYKPTNKTKCPVLKIKGGALC